jgi:hypothetical protein
MEGVVYVGQRQPGSPSKVDGDMRRQDEEPDQSEARYERPTVSVRYHRATRLRRSTANSRTVRARIAGATMTIEAFETVPTS